MNENQLLHHKNLRKSGGFTLVEIAVVLVIIGLLIGGLLPTLSTQIEQQRRRETQRYMDEVHDALVGYAVINDRLPCPDTNNDGLEDIAAPTITNDIPVSGQSTKKFSCSASAGNTPYNTLGVFNTDGFNSTLIYAVTAAFGERNEIYSAIDGGGSLLSTSYFSLSSAGTIHICSAAASPTSSPCTPALASNGIAAIVSRGGNWADAPLTDEFENADSDSDFVSHTPTPTFDDLVVWISPGALMNRMVMAGKLP